MERHVSEETKRKISNTLKGRKTGPRSEETKRKISEKLKGRPCSEYVKRRASETHKGKVISEETRRKMSAAQHAKKPVRVTDMNTQQVMVFPSQKEACKTLNILTQMSYVLTVQHGRYKNYYVESISKEEYEALKN